MSYERKYRSLRVRLVKDGITDGVTLAKERGRECYVAFWEKCRSQTKEHEQ